MCVLGLGRFRGVGWRESDVDERAWGSRWRWAWGWGRGWGGQGCAKRRGAWWLRSVRACARVYGRGDNWAGRGWGRGWGRGRGRGWGREVTNPGARALQHLARPRRRLTDDRVLAPPVCRISTAAGARAGRASRRLAGLRIGHSHRLLLRQPRIVRLCLRASARGSRLRIRRPVRGLVHAHLRQRLARRQPVPARALQRRQYVRPLAIGPARRTT